jgi:hypothetical protein
MGMRWLAAGPRKRVHRQFRGGRPVRGAAGVVHKSAKRDDLPSAGHSSSALVFAYYAFVFGERVVHVPEYFSHILIALRSGLERTAHVITCNGCRHMIAIDVLQRLGLKEGGCSM